MRGTKKRGARRKIAEKDDASTPRSKKKKLLIQSLHGEHSPRSFVRSLEASGALDAMLGGSKYVSNDHMTFVVKLFVTSAKPNYSMPWQMEKQRKSTGTGFIIDGRRILTNAHCVAYQTSVKVRRHGSPEKVRARVVCVGHDCDLAILTVDDNENFWKDVEKGLTLDETLPALQDSVTVVGYPTGGENLSVTAGVVSRVDMQRYSHSDSSLLTIQIDAAINAGNSGGPVFHHGKVVGIAFETLDDADNIGYIIPVVVAKHFLAETDMIAKKKQKAYIGFGAVGTRWQNVENESLRKFLKMKETHTGPMLSDLNPLSHAFQVLKKGDVVLEIEGNKVADDGTVQFRGQERVAFKYYVTSKFVGESVRLGVLRDGKKKTIRVRVQQVDNLVPSNLYDRRPEYFVHAGLVFTVLSEPFMQSEYGKSWMCKAPVRFVKDALYGRKMKKGEQIVVLSQILSHDVNMGYTDGMTPRRIFAFNDETILNLADLARKVRNCRSKFLRFGLSDNKAIVMDSKLAASATSDVLASHNIPDEMSEGLLS